MRSKIYKQQFKFTKMMRRTTIKIDKISVILIALFSISFFNVSATLNIDTTVEITYVKIGVDGMACPFCAYGVEKKIKKIEGVENFYVDINEGFITFSVPSDKKPTEEELKKLIKEAGFRIRNIEYASRPFETHK